MKLEAKDPRLVLKTAAPKVPKNLLVRERLSMHAPELTGKSVIAVQAASGFGKTLLLAQWRREVLATGGVVAWLTIDPWDDEGLFAHGLAVAMQVASGRPRFGQSYLQAPDQRSGQHEALTGWLAEVVGLGAEVVLILDDVHLLPEATAANALLYLLHNAPANLKIVMAARKPLVLQVADLLSRGQYASLDVEALRFRRAETISLLSARFGARIGLDSCAQLHELTEGWPLGLQLAIAQVEKSPNIKEAIAKSFVRSGDIRRYFVESLVDRLQPRESDFLVNVSFLDALHPGLCDAITGDTDSGDILKHLSEATPIIGEGVGSVWRRIHPLAREFLNERFEALAEEHKRSLRERAVRWLAEQKIYEEAARLALHSGQMELAYELAEQCLYDVLKTGQHFRVAAWVDRIPAQEIAHRPRLRLAVAWALALSERHIEAAQMVLPLMEDPSAEESARCESAEICSTAAFFADDLDRMQQVISPWLDHLSSYPDVLRMVGSNHRAMLAMWQGMPDKARYIFELAQVDESLSGGYAIGWRDWITGLSYLWEGQVVLAEESLRTSLAHAEETSGHRNPIAAMLSATLSAVLWDRNKQAEIAALLADRQDVIERHTAPDSIILSHITSARLAVSCGQERRAFEVLDRLFALGEIRSLPRLCISSLCEQMQLHALQGRAAACVALATRLDNLAPASDKSRWGMLQQVIQIQVALAHGHLYAVQNQWKQVLTEVDAALPIANTLRRGKDRIQLQLLKALALKRCGQDGEALLAEALSMTRMLGLERMLQDTHPDLESWAHQKDKAPVNSPAPVLDHKGPVTSLQHSALLTPKEREVLQLLARNMSNKEIALVMEIGGETVKWHLKNLFDKFDAANRKHLLHRAQMLGVVDAPH
jgi:LuxR family maltose regulon positive regulatory protein